MGSARAGIGGATQHQHGHAGFLGRDGQAAARGQIEGARLLPGLDQHRRELLAAHRIARGAQQRNLIGGLHFDDAGGIEAKVDQSRPVKLTKAARRIALPQPQQRPAAQPHCQHQRKAGHAGLVDGIGSKELMQSSARKAAAQPRIEQGMAQRKQRCIARWHRPFDRADARS